MSELKQLGVNTVRTYGEDPGAVLAEAERRGLKVIAGFWLEQPRRGFDYGNAAAVAAQLARLRDTVRRYRGHPALLLWGIGNEVEGELRDDAAVWPAIEQAAALVRALDPGHPTLAVLGELGGDKAAKLKRLAPSIDVLGVNSYGDALLDLPARARAQGWTGPVLVTELGALGQWQAPRAAWGAAIEPSSTDKAARLRRYLAALEGQTAGQVLFLWGHKQEVTPTWHGLLLPSGEWVEAVEVMAERWGGATPGGNHAPRLHALRLEPGAEWDHARSGTARIEADDPDGDPLSVQWTVLAESTDLRKGGDAESVPPSFPEAVEIVAPFAARVRGLPLGEYRLLVVLRDGRGAAATANLPFRLR